MENKEKFMEYNVQLKGEYEGAFRFWKILKILAIVLLTLGCVYVLFSFMVIGTITGIAALAVQATAISFLLLGDKKAKICFYVCAAFGALSYIILFLQAGSIAMVLQALFISSTPMKYMIAYELSTPIAFLVIAIWLTSKKSKDSFVEIQEIKDKQMNFTKTL